MAARPDSGDGMQSTTHSQHGGLTSAVPVCVVAVFAVAACCRCADMPLSHLNRRRFCHVVAIIPGPSEPDHVEPYIEPLLDEFCSFGPDGE